MKFLKQFESQLVPEWKEAYVDYCKLKKDLKKFHHLAVPTNLPKPERKERHVSFPSLLSSLRKYTFGQPRNEPGAIQVHRKLASSASYGDLYETELIDQFEDNEAVKEFFKCLDDQLTKVNQFYKAKEKEYLERGELLKKQKDILLELKATLKQERGTGAPSQDSSVSCIINCEDSVKGRGEQVELGGEDNGDPFEKNQPPESQDMQKGGRSLSARSFSSRGKNISVSIPLTTPSRTLSAISYHIWEDLMNQSSRKGNSEGSKLSINKTKVRQAEKMIRGALIELYKGVGYLKTYRNLNFLAFMKILKKFDKVTGKHVQPIYLKVVESSYFNTAEKLINLSDTLEEIFVKNFADEDKRKAMKYLKPQHRKDSHPVTFFIGLFTGCFVALLAGYGIMAHIAGMYSRQTDTIYMETAYPVFSMFSLIFLHFFIYGCNIFMWKRARINFSFIFELSPTKELKYRDIFLISTAAMTAVVGAMFVHLSLLTKYPSFSQVQAIPGVLLLISMLLLVCPLNICYKSSRYRFLLVMKHIILSPLYKVVMLDFFMADQLCSQVPMLRNLEYIACYYITGSFKTQNYGYCVETKNYRDLAYAVSFLPYFWRAMQCARRWFDEGERSHLMNLGKYASAMLAAGAKVAYEKEKSPSCMWLLVVVSSAATIYQLYWDFVKDWGLLQLHSKNPWLRNELILRKKFIYYISMVLNLILRLAWLQTVVHSSFGSVDYRITGLFLASLEVIRRGQWNFYRLENEHLNNVGKFRAIKTVPLPFREVDEED